MECAERFGEKIHHLPIFGNAEDLTDFGGATVVYSWIKGAGACLENKVFNKWVEDKESKIMFTSRDYTRNFTVDQKKFKYHSKFTGEMEKSTNTFTIYVYTKCEKIVRNRISRYIESKGMLSKAVRKAFVLSNTYKGLKKDQKSTSLAMKYITDAQK